MEGSGIGTGERNIKTFSWYEVKQELLEKEEGGTKHDEGKPRIDLIDPYFLTELGRAMGYGAQKYSANNWREGMAHGRYFAALMRHMWAYWGGEDKDAESGLSHLSHAAASLMMLMGMTKTRPDLDDRWKEEE